VKTSFWWLGAHAALSFVMFESPALAANALPQFLGVNAVTRTPIIVTEEQLEVSCMGDPPLLDCASSSVLTLSNRTAGRVDLHLEVDATANAWSVDGAAMAVTGDATGDGLMLLQAPVVFAAQQTIRIKVTYATVRFDGRPEATNLQIQGFDLSPPITYWHPLVAHPAERATAVELWTTGVRSDRYKQVLKHSVQITIPAGWEVHSTPGLVTTNDRGERQITLSSTDSSPADGPHFRMQTVLNAPPKPFPLGPFAAVGYRWEQRCPSCKDSVFVRAGIDLSLCYFFSLGVAGEYSDSKHSLGALTLDFTAPLNILSKYVPMVRLGAGVPVRLLSSPEIGIRGQLQVGYNLHYANLAGGLMADWFPGSSNGRWALAPMLVLGI
jgi:hypothetical protein